jgi:hypothetical protein
VLKKYILSLVIAAILAFSNAIPVLAVQNQGSTSGNSSSGNDNAGTGTGNIDSLHDGTGTGDSTQTQAGQDDSTTAGQGQGLSSERKQTCENRQNSINTTMSQYSATVQNRLLLFNKIVERIQTYYIENNLNVPEYEQLMAIVASQQQITTEAMTQVRQGNTIDCGSGDPIGTAQQFRTHVQTAQGDLDQYRTAIHNLLTAVISAAESSEQ